jgi:hypothetical protein
MEALAAKQDERADAVLIDSDWGFVDGTRALREHRGRDNGDGEDSNEG